MNKTFNLEKPIHFKVFNLIYLTIILVGTVSNTIAFVIFSRKKFENTLFSTYFRVLLLVDTFGLLYLTSAKFLLFEFNINLRDLNIFLCRITMPMAYSIPQISAHLTVLISLDRWLSIAKPTEFLFRKKKKFQLNVCAIIILVNFIYNGQLFFSYLGYNSDYNKNFVICLIYDENLLSIMDLINSTLLPFILMFAFSLLTINAVFFSRRRIRNSILNTRMASINRDLETQYDLMRKRDIRLAINSILLNFIFLLFNGPQSIFFFVSRYVIKKRIFSDYHIQSALMLSYLNHASVFFINLMVNTKFRNELFDWFHEKKNVLSNHIQSYQYHSPKT